MKTDGDNVLDSDLHLALYDIIDGWHHDRTRFHLVDVDPDANEMLKSIVALINQRIVEELEAVLNFWEHPKLAPHFLAERIAELRGEQTNAE